MCLSGNGFYSARVAAIELDEQDVGTRYRGATALSAQNLDSLVISSTLTSQLIRLDLSEQVQCQPWMTEDLREWDVANDGVPQRSSPVKLMLSSLSGTSSKWQLDVTRVVGQFKSLGISEKYQTNRVGDAYMWQKNMMCASLVQDSVNPMEPVQASKCCVYKQADSIPPPESCPKPARATCTSKYKVATQDYDYALQQIEKDLKMGEGILV